MGRRPLAAPAVPAAQLLEVLQTYRLELHPDLVLRRAATMRLVRQKEDNLRFVRPLGDDLAGAVLWEEEARGLRHIGSIYTLHRFDFDGCFKASWAEVIAMVPDHMFAHVRALEIIGPMATNEQLRQHAAREVGTLVALTLLYTF